MISKKFLKLFRLKDLEGQMICLESCQCVFRHSLLWPLSKQNLQGMQFGHQDQVFAWFCDYFMN